MGCECKQANRDSLASMMLPSLRGVTSHLHNKQVTHVNKTMCCCGVIQIKSALTANFKKAALMSCDRLDNKSLMNWCRLGLLLMSLDSLDIRTCWFLQLQTHDYATISPDFILIYILFQSPGALCTTNYFTFLSVSWFSVSLFHCLNMVWTYCSITQGCQTGGYSFYEVMMFRTHC